MQLPRRWFVFLPLFIALTVPALAKDRGPFPGSEEKWDCYESPNFELYSRNGDADSRSLLRNLELLRATFLKNFKLIERRPVPVTIYYFSGDREMAAYKPESQSKDREMAGYYLPRMDRAVIVMSSEQGEDALRGIVFHEYIHHIFRICEETPPVWYNEGMAELFSTIEVGTDTLTFGRPRADHVTDLRFDRLLPLDVLLTVDHDSPIYNSGKHTGVFYAESWALMHYLYFGKSDLPRDRVDAFLSYAQRAGEKVDASAIHKAFQETLQMDYPEMVSRLERYVQSGKYGWGKLPMPAIAAQSTYTKRPVDHPEIRERLAELTLRINRSAQGKLALMQAVEANPKNVRALETLGMNSVLEEDEIGARERWERAVAADSRNPAIYHELGMMESRRWFRQFDYYFRMPAERTEQLRLLLHRSIDYAPNQSAAYEMLAWVESAAPTPSIPNVNLVQQHFNTLKDKPRTLLALALVRVRMNDHDTANSLLNTIETMPVDKHNAATMASAVKYVRARMENRPAEDTAASVTTEPVEASELDIQSKIAPPRPALPK